MTLHYIEGRFETFLRQNSSRHTHACLPGSEGLSVASTEGTLGLDTGNGSWSDFGRGRGISPLCLQKKETAIIKLVSLPVMFNLFLWTFWNHGIAPE